MPTKKNKGKDLHDNFIPKAVVGYMRYSDYSKRNNPNTITLEVQETKIREYAQSKNLPIRGEIFKDEGISGYTESKRKGYLAMKESLKEGDILFVYDISRLARNLINLVTFVDELYEKGARLVTHEFNIDTTTPSGKFMLQVMGSVSEFERNSVGEKVSEGIQLKKESGKIYTKPPYGWKKVVGSPKGTPYIKDETEQGIIKRVIKLKDEGKTITEIARVLTNENVPHCKNSIWRYKYVKHIIDFYNNPPLWAQEPKETLNTV